MAAGEYPVGLDEDMGPERTGSGPMGFGSNRKISMIFPLVSCCSCVNNPSSV